MHLMRETAFNTFDEELNLLLSRLHEIPEDKKYAILADLEIGRAHV